MTTLVTKLLGPPEKVAPFAFFPTRPHRWMIFETQYFKVYLHHTYNEDLDVYLRAYPGQFISFGFANSNGGPLLQLRMQFLIERRGWC
jgi:hypothetical protein